MDSPKKNDQEIWDVLKSGCFVVARSEIPFTRLFTDQALEQEIKKQKNYVGMFGLSRNKAT